MKLGSKEVEFRKGFKPKSLSEFSKIFKAITGASEKELKAAYKKLGGDIKSTNRKTKSDKSSEPS